jgi:hypothetical protein
MPCRDYDDDSQRIKDLYEKVGELTRMLCATCQIVEESGLVLPKESRKWWTAHKAADEREKQYKRALMEERALKTAAYKKLTPAERKALGVRNPADEDTEL